MVNNNHGKVIFNSYEENVMKFMYFKRLNMIYCLEVFICGINKIKKEKNKGYSNLRLLFVAELKLKAIMNWIIR